MNNPTMTKQRKTAHCRVVITDECNLSCDFCCMKDEKIHDSFEDSTALWIAQQMHKEVSITGGEPLLVLPKVVMFSQIVRYFNPNVKLWLYTNGELLTKSVARTLKLVGFDGISVSPHGQFSWETKMNYLDIHHIMPLRFMMQDTEIDCQSRSFFDRNNMLYRVWEIGDCNEMPFESRYRLKDPDLRWS